MAGSYPAITCQAEYLDYYAHKANALWSDVPAADLPAVYAGIDRCRVTTLTRYCDEGYADACAEIGRAVELSHQPLPTDSSAGFWEVLPSVAVEDLANLPTTLRRGSTILADTAAALATAATAVPKGLLAGAGIELPSLPDTLGLVKVLGVAAIVVGAIYLSKKR